MRTLTLRIYLTVVAVLLLFAFGSGWLFQNRIEQERSRAQNVLGERMEAWADLIQRSLPGVQAPVEEQAAAVRDWSQRLRIPLALDSPSGQRIAVSESYQRREAEGVARGFSMRLQDGRMLWVMRPGLGRYGGGGAGAGEGRGPRAAPGPLGMALPTLQRGLQSGVGLAIVLVLLFVAVALGAWPVVRRLTHRLQSLQQGVEAFGAGRLQHRVEVSGRDEVAALARSFNQAAERIEALVRSHQSLLANASHELRSPLARMRMAVSMLDDAASPEQRARLRREIDTNVAELDALVEEVLLASRLDAQPPPESHDDVDVLALAAEEAARVDARLEPPATGEATPSVQGEERLVRRALRNLLENARRYGGSDVSVHVSGSAGSVRVQVCDRGPGVPESQRERIFEPFYRLPGHGETQGGVGLGLSLVRQIAERHGGRVQCLPREGGGTCFDLTLPCRAGARHR